MTTKSAHSTSSSASGPAASARAVGLTWSTVLLVLLLAAGCRSTTPAEPVPSILPPDARIRFAVIGDYGQGGPDEAAVARLVRGWSPDFVITTGDNNYPKGAAETIDDNVGQYYAAFIAPYKGRFGPGASENRFFPSLGNHDTHAAGWKPYLDYFTLPGNGRYYQFDAGPVSFFALDSVVNEPDGVKRRSRQAKWLHERLAASHSCWRFAYFHHPPYASSGKEKKHMRWPFAAWGVDAVLTGHQHTYERLAADGVTYLIVGVSGAEIDKFQATSPASVVRYNAAHGAVLATADHGSATFQFFTVDGQLIDESHLEKRCDAPPSGAPH
jgi:hypothetical protein